MYALFCSYYTLPQKKFHFSHYIGTYKMRDFTLSCNAYLDSVFLSALLKLTLIFNI